MKYEIKTFDIPELDGISRETIEIHLGLYAGYVNHVNLIQEEIESVSKSDSSSVAKMLLRLGFEFGGMKNHETYFAQFEGGGKGETDDSFRKKIELQWKDFNVWLDQFKAMAKTRGVGWAMLYMDEDTGKFMQTWVDEQHVGHLPGCKVVLALDMWEHSYLRDYLPAAKDQYIDAFFKNINWEVVSNRV